MLFFISTIGKIAPFFIALSIPISYACVITCKNIKVRIKAKKQKCSSRTYSNPFYATNRMEPTCGHNPNHLAESSPTALHWTTLPFELLLLSSALKDAYIFIMSTVSKTLEGLSVFILAFFAVRAMQCLSIFWKFF